MKKLIFIILAFAYIQCSAQTIKYGEAEYLLTLNFDKANSALVAKEFEYTSSKSFTNSKWLFYRRLSNDKDYEVGIQVSNEGSVVGFNLLTTNFYEANLFKIEIEKRQEILGSKLNGQDLNTQYQSSENSKRTASYTISIDPNGTKTKVYSIFLRDNE